MRYHKGAVAACISILVNVALLLAFVEAPFLHVHEHEATQRHSGPLFHIHLKHFQPAQPGKLEFRGWDPDEDAQYQQWFSAAGYSAAFTPIVLTTVFRAPKLAIRAWAPPAVRPAAHDPPDLDARPARAPPA